ncbi:MAG: hypothetical protein M1816_003999 [Peltula sp. TS41687]|nr:MAG: hypothetical protein M1816_003999 [Peltula sp. TS41687]
MLSPMACRSILTRCLRASSTYSTPSCVARKSISSSSSQALSNRSHQRRSSSSSSSSSSKPSNIPPHSARAVSQQRQETPSGTSSVEPAQFDDDGRRSSSARLGRRKAREATAEAASLRGQKEFLRSLRVPTTNHVHPADIAISDFFSLHRPISVTSSVPTAANASSFESIFRPAASQPVNASEVISTISTAISALEASPHHQQQSPESRTYDSATDSEFCAAIASVSSSNAGGIVNHLDGNSNDEMAPSPELFGQLLSGRYRPFVPPPVPIPNHDPSNNTTSSDLSPASEDIRRKTYSTFLTILEATHPNGLKTYKAYTSPIMIKDLSPTSASSSSSSEDQDNDEGRESISRPTPAAFLERMWIRQQRWEDYRRGREADRVWEAISVKRQRRLKMKKHKYKKLMRKTRNLRRKMERT